MEAARTHRCDGGPALTRTGANRSIQMCCARSCALFLTLAEMRLCAPKSKKNAPCKYELVRRLNDAQSRVGAAKELVAVSVESTARNKACKAFIDARGTR